MLIRRLELVALVFALGAAAQTVDLVQDKQTPNAIVPGVHTKLTVEFRITGAVTDVRISPVWASTTELPLTSTAKGVWTIDLPVDKILANTAVADIYRPFVGFVNLYNGATRVFQYNFFTQVAPTDIPRVAVTKVADDFQYTPYIANIQLPAAFPDPFAAAPANTNTIPSQNLIARRFYQVFSDDYDVLNIVYVPSVRTNRFHYSVKNTVLGIGATQLDNSATYGSQGKLVGISTFPISSLFDGAEDTYEHEFTHQFVDFLNFAPFKDSVPHWPYSTMATGIMGISIAGTNVGGNYSCVLTPTGSNLLAAPLKSNPIKSFNDFDLYLMGLIPPSEVKDQYVVTDTALATACNSTIPPGSFVHVTVNDIINGAGARVPAAAVSKHDYRLGNIVVTEGGLLSADEMALYTYFTRRAEERTQVPYHNGFELGNSNPFYLATGQRATFNTQLKSVTWPSISPGGVVNGASFTAAVAPGGFTSIYGQLLSPSTASAPSATLPSSLAGVTVLVNGQTAPVYYVSAGQLNFQMPFETKPGLATVTVLTPQGPSNSAWLTVTQAAPGILLYGNNRAVATNQDGSLNGPGSAAAPGTVITAYFTGVGPVAGTMVTGQPAAVDPLPQSTLQYVATVGGKRAELLYIGLTPGYAGLAQANVRIPTGLPAGDVLLQLITGTTPSNAPLVNISGAP
jgi:uncharacterized protein (TIGR03437 family)